MYFTSTPALNSMEAIKLAVDVPWKSERLCQIRGRSLPIRRG